MADPAQSRFGRTLASDSCWNLLNIRPSGGVVLCEINKMRQATEQFETGQCLSAELQPLICAVG